MFTHYLFPHVIVLRVRSQWARTSGLITKSHLRRDINCVTADPLDRGGAGQSSESRNPNHQTELINQTGKYHQELLCILWYLPSFRIALNKLNRSAKYDDRCEVMDHHCIRITGANCHFINRSSFQFIVLVCEDAVLLLNWSHGIQNCLLERGIAARRNLSPSRLTR